MSSIASAVKARISNRVMLAGIALAITLGAGYTAVNLLPAVLSGNIFSVYLTPGVANQTVLPGTRNHIFTKITLDATQYSSPVVVKEINLSVKTYNVAPADVRNFGLYVGDIRLATTNDPDFYTATKTTAGDSHVQFKLTEPLSLALGEVKVLTVKADVSGVAPVGGSYRVGIRQTLLSKWQTVVATWAGADGTIKNVSPTYTNGFSTTNFVAGSLTITRDAASPRSGLMSSNTADVRVAIFNVTAANEDIKIEKLYITGVQINNGGWDQVRELRIYNGVTLVGSAVPTSTDGVDRTVLVDMTSRPLVVSKGTTVKLIIKVNTGNSNGLIGSSGASGEGIMLKINSPTDVYAKGVTSAATIKSKNIANASSTLQYLFRSVPIITLNENLGLGKVVGGALASASSTDLYAFSVTADSIGDVGFKQVAFNITKENVVVTASTLKLMDASTSDIMASFSRQDGNRYVLESGDVITVPAGTTKRYLLRGDVDCSVASGCGGSGGSGTLAIQFLGDTGFPSPLPTNMAGLSTSNFGWTDFWQNPVQGASAPTVLTANQWSNGYLIGMSNGGILPATSMAVTFAR